VEGKYKAAGLYAQGQSLIEQGAWAQAIQALQAALAADPGHALARQALDQAVASLRQDQQVKTADLLSRSQDAQQREAWQESVGLLQQALAIEPNNPQAKAMLVQAQAKLKQQQAGSLYADAQAAISAQNWALAATRLNSVLSIDPAHLTARAELANVQRQQKIATLGAEASAAQAQGNWRGAAAKYQALLNLDPGNLEAATNLANVQKILQEQNIPMPPAQPDFTPSWQTSEQAPPQQPKGTPEARTYDLPGFEIQPLVDEIRQYFMQKGYENQVVSSEGSTIIQGKKGGLRSLVGMGQAATVILEPTASGVKASVGGGKWLEQGAAIAVSMFVLWPLLITGAAGIIGQKELIDTLWRMVDYHITTRGGTRTG
jgi:tetratricopeptide (TPR) repeat protein